MSGPIPTAISSAAPLGPEQTSSQKRLTNLHITAYPGLINADLLPEAARQATDFSAIDPLIHRKNHAVRNNNVTTFTGASTEEHPVTMLTEKQITAQLTALGMKRRKELSQERQAASNGENSGPSPASTDMLCPKGYHTQQLAPPFDERSTYRADYCQAAVGGFQDAARRAHLAGYRSTWSEKEIKDVETSMKPPYLTCPDSICHGQPTEYRAGFMPEADISDFRTLSHQTNLQELGTTFAYSAYSVDDPRRTVSYDDKVASLREPRNFLYDGNRKATHGSGKPRSQKEESELQKMRTLRTESLKRSCVLRESRRAAATAAAVNVGDSSTDVSAASGVYAHSRRPADYIYLPRSTAV